MDTKSIVLIDKGEPFFDPRLIDIIQVAKKRAFEVILYTKSTLIDTGLCRFLVESGLDTLRLSLWSASAKDYKRQYSGKPPENFQ